MEPPSYEEARLQPPALSSANVPPPPSYSASLSSPSTPPPSYQEAVTVQPDPFPVLAPPTLPPAVTSQNTTLIFHPPTQIGVTASVSSRVTQTVIVTQPQRSRTVSVTHLRDVPGVVRCPYCHHVVTSQVTYLPGRAAWCLCILLTAMGLVCGFCLIPFVVRSLQDAHHSCPRCGKHLYVYTR